MRRIFAVFLLSIFAFSAFSAVPADIQVSVNPNLPVALYKGPATYRRDSRGRPFKSIIVTSSKLFGIGNSAGSNSVRDSSTSSSTTSTTTTPSPPPRSSLNNVGQRLKPFIVTSRPFGFANSASNFVRDSSTASPTTTSTTTPSPLIDKATPTIPFFSISCTVGRSCSQIISARQTQTVKPTFKPYTKEEINKFKGTLGSRFPPKVASSTLNSGMPEISATTTTTENPSTEKLTNLWRIRTTLPSNPATNILYSSPLSSTTTTRPVQNKPSNNWSSRWKWPTHIGSVASEDHKQDEIESNNQRVETVTSEPIFAVVKSSPQVALRHPTNVSEYPIRTNTYSVKPYTTKEKNDHSKENYPIHRPEEIAKLAVATAGNNNGNWLSLLAASLTVLQNQYQNLNPSQRPQPQQTMQQTKIPPPPLPLSSPFPQKTVSKPVKRPNPTVAPIQQDRWNSPVSTNAEEENSLSWPEKASGFTGYSISLPENDQDYHRHEVISSKGNKISLITGSSTRNKHTHNPVKAVQSNQYNAYRDNLPPEVSV